MIHVVNNPIDYVNSFAHLGHAITNQLADSADILKRQYDFVKQASKMLFLLAASTKALTINFLRHAV